MTALAEYARLETFGLWRPDAGAPPQGVTVSLGDATLVMSDSGGRALAHWSLPAVERIGGGLPAVFAPDLGGVETLEIEEPDMVEAIERVRRAVRRGERARGRRRLRAALAAALLGAGALAAILVLPGALTRHALAVVPAEARAAIGSGLLARMTARAGRPCDGPGGAAALAALSARVFDPAPALVVLPTSMPAPALLPGGTIVLPRAAVEAVDAPEAAAGWAIEAAARAEDPLEALLRRAGLGQTVRLSDDRDGRP